MTHMFQHRQLTASVRKYLKEERCLSDEVIKRYKIVGGTYGGRECIAIPVVSKGKDGIAYRLRMMSGDGPRYLWHPKGNEAVLYPQSILLQKPRQLVLTEGEFDALALISRKIPAITSTAGAGTFKEEWVDMLPQNCEIVICYDRDGAGKKGADKTLALLKEKRPDLRLSITDLPEMPGNGKDVTDFIRHCLQKKLKPEKEFRALIKPAREDDAPEHSREEQRPRIATLKPAERPMEINEWKRIISENFPDLALPAEIALSVVAQLLIKDISNPFALVLIDVPAAGKTITINFFAEAGLPELMYASDKFSPASFVSNAANVKREELEKVDLLPRIRYRTFCIRDLATVFSAKEDDLVSNVGIMTRVLDGEGLATDGGVHGQRARTGDYLFMLLAASTPIPRRVWKIMGNQGPRLFFLGLHTRTKTPEELVKQLQGNACKEKELICRKATQDLLRTLWSSHPDGVAWDKEKEQGDPGNLLLTISRCAGLLARLRGTLNTDRERSDTGEELVYHSPVIEKPDRLNQLLYNLARAHAVAMGRDRLAEEDIACVLILSCDSAPGHRAELLHALIKRGGKIATGQAERALNVSKPTALHDMQTLRILGICEEWEPADVTTEKGIKFKDEFAWLSSAETRRLLYGYTGSDSLYPDTG